MGAGWSSALFYYGDDALNQYRYERLDLRLAKRFRVHGSNLVRRRCGSSGWTMNPPRQSRTATTAATA